MTVYLGSLLNRFIYPQMLILLLVLLASATVAFGLATNIKGIDQVFMVWIGLLGVLTGRVISQTKVSSPLGIGLGVLAGWAYLLAKYGGLFPRMWFAVWSISIPDLLDASLRAWPLRAWSLPAWAAGELTGAAVVVANRLVSWFSSLFSGSAVFDPLAVSWVWGATLWFTAVWAGWGTRRRWPGIRVLLPGIVLVGAVLGYIQGSSLSLAILLTLTFLTCLVTAQTHREHRWTIHNTDFSNEIRIDLAMVGIAVTLLLMTAAIATPSISIRRLVETIDNWISPAAAVRSPVGEPLGLKPPPRHSPVAELLYPGLPRDHLIGSGPELSERPVMTVRPAEPLQALSQAPGETPQPVYWRGLTYDRYTGSGWATSPTYYTLVDPPNIPASAVDPTKFRRLGLEIEHFQTDEGVLYFTGQLESANQPFEMYKRTQDDLFAAYISERAYQVASQIPTYPRSHAREAGRDYPDWIRDRYLSLPEELPDRVRSLAVQISAHAATPYDQVLAIETYLRTIPYNLDIPFPPGDQDIVDYFLFDLKQGYCDYYASAMVVLVRSIGIPARLVIGYSSGSYDPPDAVYRVSEANAHSWPEVYFPGLGWMEFEPTSALPILQDPASLPPIPENQIDSSAPLPTNANGPLAGSPLPWIAGIVGAAAVIGFALPPLMDYRLLETSSPASALLVLYQRLWTQASQGKLPVNVSDTPYEFAAILADYFRPLENSPHWLKRLIDPHDIWRFTGLVVPSMYSHHTPDRQAAFSAWRYSRRIQRALVVLNIIRRIPGRRFYPIDRDAV